MAGLSGDFMGDIGSQAATRHRTKKMAKKYRSRPMKCILSPENKAVVNHAGTLFYKAKDEVRATICDQSDVIKLQAV